MAIPWWKKIEWQYDQWARLVAILGGRELSGSLINGQDREHPCYDQDV